MSHKLTISKLSVSKDGEQLLAPVSLEIESSFFLAVVGNNGIGKSTFLKCLTDQQAYSGQITSTFDSGDISYLPQTQEITFNLKVKDIVVMGLYSRLSLLENYTTDHYQRVKTILTELSIDQLYDRDFKDLSGGQKQLVWLAQTLIKKPKLLILDEPTAHLDVTNKVKLFRLLEHLNIHKEISIICVTHDLYLLRKIKGKALNLNATPSEILDLTDQTIDYFYEID